jgi:hypothetical protein
MRVILFLLALMGPASAMVKSEPAPLLAPYAVMVLGSKGSFCSAIVLNPYVLLTAAHCVSGSPDYRVHWRDKDGQPVLREPAAIVLHPGYAKNAARDRKRSIDLAMIRLAEPLPPQFKSVALSDLRPRTDDRLIVGGYGLSTENDPATGGTFRAATLATIEPYGPSSILVWLSDPVSGPKAKGAGACTGDSGGPIFDSAYALVAVTVYAEGPGQARCGALTQGLLVAPQRSFIETTLKKWQR